MKCLSRLEHQGHRTGKAHENGHKACRQSRRAQVFEKAHLCILSPGLLHDGPFRRPRITRAAITPEYIAASAFYISARVLFEQKFQSSILEPSSTTELLGRCRKSETRLAFLCIWANSFSRQWAMELFMRGMMRSRDRK